MSVLVTAANATIAFDPPVLLENKDGTAGSACGDLDKDGRIEFVTQELFAIYDFEDGAINTYRPLPNIDTRLDRFGGDIEIGDINGDTWPDIVLTDTSNSGDTGELIWFENPLGDLGGTWTEHSVSVWDGIDVGNQITHAEEELGDINDDGLLDIVVRDIRHGFWIHLQNPEGGWHPRVFVATNPREGLDLWNPDGDDDLDILLNGVWFETPDDPLSGTYTLHAVSGMEDWYPSGNTSNEIDDYACKVIAADINGDLKDDIVISNAEELKALSPTKPHGIVIYLQPADILLDPWIPVVVTPDHFSWHTLQVRDMNHDGHLDIVAAVSLVGADTAEAESNIWLNDGTVNFIKTPIAADFGYQGEVGDSDGDGDHDFLLPETFSSGEVRLYENISTIIPSTGFSLYMQSFGLEGPDALPGVDYDKDTLTNMIEFVLGTDPTESTPASEHPKLTPIPGGSTFTFRRFDESIPNDPSAAHSTDLEEFTPAVDGVDGISVTVTDDGFGEGIDRVETSFPDSLAEDGRLFARLQATPQTIAEINFAAFLTGFTLSTGNSQALTDFDQDGLANQFEFVFGTDPTTYTPASDRPSIAAVEGGYLVTFRRSDAAISTFPTVHYSSNLVSYQPAVNGVNGVTIAVTDDGFEEGVDRIEVFLPDTLEENGRLFTKLTLEAGFD
ncbi:FG-GAP repeat domain-containing protein [Haloferula sp.]|uniref:FG-GAP repeat domain-containing protein n=1 Tax=Haloferula sp. TaxID=2497595 RepID=UPI00329DAEDE